MAASHSDLLAAKSSMSRRGLAKAVPDATTAFDLAAALNAAQNVVGVSVDTKFSHGKETTTKCVRFCVGQKIGPDALAGKDLLPTEIDGIPTDVIVIGKFRTLDTTADNKKRRRPVRPGISIGFKFPPPMRSASSAPAASRSTSRWPARATGRVRFTSACRRRPAPSRIAR